MNPPRFQTKTIEEVIDTLIDYRGKTPEKAPSGVKLITAKVIKGGRIQDDNHEFIAEEDYEGWMRRGLPRQWDILLTTEAPLGEVAQLRTTERVALAQRVILLRGNPKVIDQGYFFQTVKSPFVQSELAARATGTTVLGIKQSELRQVRIPLFPLPTQRNIAAILSAYDDLIENNTRRIQLLERMAQALYREWFVHFRYPGHAKVKRVASPLGPIPQGWQMSEFSSVAEIARAGINPAQYPDEKFWHYSIPAFDAGCMPLLEPGDTILSNKFLLETDCVLLSKLNPRIPRVWLPRLEPTYRAIASTEFLALIPRSGFTLPYVFSLCCSDEFRGAFVGRALGTSTSHQRVKPDDLFQLRVVLPTPGTVAMFTEQVEPMLALVHNLRRKVVNLRRCRDLLLPKLISGALDVSKLDLEAA